MLYNHNNPSFQNSFSSPQKNPVMLYNYDNPSSHNSFSSPQKNPVMFYNHDNPSSQNSFSSPSYLFSCYGLSIYLSILVFTLYQQ
ncbi:MULTISPECIES: hypothetical protein [Porphyromonas]|uniref:hypothetical protein n=1 Tax=Porphyromonas TaxID=836 RepID=UPI00051D7F99|nr:MULTISPECIES: hypothetical protein [Porphyromonas]KGL53375.1 hypothetical protein HQ29_02035 [Porphyromonas canoris]KGN69539.1 hypothetical protein JT26_04820 [Porphyromonas sp. COT-108 OH1349]